MERIALISDIHANIPALEAVLFFDFYMSGKLIRLCHASPTSVFDRVRSTAAIEEKLKLFAAPNIETRECDVLIFNAG